MTPSLAQCERIGGCESSLLLLISVLSSRSGARSLPADHHQTLLLLYVLVFSD